LAAARWGDNCPVLLEIIAMAIPKNRAAPLTWLLLIVTAAACADAPPAAPAAPVASAPTISAPGIAAAALEQRLAGPGDKPTLLDVRTPEEFAAGHVPGARNIPLAELESRLAELSAARAGDVVVYCRSGRRAATALDILKAHGFEHLLHLEGDMQGWSASGRRVEGADPSPPEQQH
jgi:phage shock protein E